MKLTLKPLAAAVPIATTQFSGVAFAQTTKAPAAPAAARAPVATDRIRHDTIPTPVSDESQHHFGSVA